MNNLDVLLINAPYPTPSLSYAVEHQGMPPLGLGYLATCLAKEDYSVKIVDMLLPDVTIENVMHFFSHGHVRMLGISCTTETYKSGLLVAKVIKEKHADCIIVFGGSHVSFEYKSALDTGLVDFIVINEGENSLKKLCDYCIRGTATLDSLKGIAYKKNNFIHCAEPEPFIKNLDDLPFPDRTLFGNLTDYVCPATIITSRGCPGKCIFCAASVLSGGRYRMRSAKNVVDEFEYLKSLGLDHVFVLDDTMTANLARLDQFLDEMLTRDLQMSWYCESRVDRITKDILSKMKTAGMSNIQFGVESGNQKILDSIKKEITLEQVRNVFLWCNELGIGAVTNVIIGQPDDTESTILETIQLAEELRTYGVTVLTSICTPFPGTPLWENPEDFGVEFVESDLDYYNTRFPVMNTRYMNATEIRNAYFNATNTIGANTSLGANTSRRIPHETTN